jgi:TonB family protein
MTIWRMARWAVIALATWGILGAVPASAQETLARAKSVYASAGYEEALTILDNLRSSAPATDAEEIAVYQVFCLMALGRSDEARHAIEAIVRQDPLYHPTDAQASPRVLQFFEDVRKPLLPQIVKDTYAKAKSDFDQKDMHTAVTEFDRVIALVTDMSTNDSGTNDLKTLATGFRDLAKSAAAPPPPPPAADPAPVPSVPAGTDSNQTAVSVTMDPPAATPTTEAAATPNDPNKIYSAQDADVKAPITVSHDMPAWNPANAVEKKSSFSGIIELVIDENGMVMSATMRQGTLAAYDAALVKAAANWKFKPATRNGAPVKYRVHLSIQLGR